MELVAIIGTALVNGLITWGVIRTEMKYLRRDVDHAQHRIDELAAGRCPVGFQKGKLAQ